MNDDKCPVCGKGDIEGHENARGNITVSRVSHLDCVLSLADVSEPIAKRCAKAEAEVARLSGLLLTICEADTERQKQLEAEVAKLRWMLNASMDDFLAYQDRRAAERGGISLMDLGELKEIAEESLDRRYKEAHRD